jgi:hypothetical protein
MGAKKSSCLPGLRLLEASARLQSPLAIMRPKETKFQKAEAVLRRLKRLPCRTGLRDRQLTDHFLGRANIQVLASDSARIAYAAPSFFDLDIGPTPGLRRHLF